MAWRLTDILYFLLVNDSYGLTLLATDLNCFALK